MSWELGVLNVQQKHDVVAHRYWNGIFFVFWIAKKIEVYNPNSLRAVNEVACLFKINKLYAFLFNSDDQDEERILTFAAEKLK